MSFSEACDELLKTGILDHEHGIPKLWHKSADELQKPQGPHDQYYNLNKRLLANLDEIVYKDKFKQLRALSADEIDSLYEEMIQSEPLKSLPPGTDLDAFLENHTKAFKTGVLMGDYLPSALPIVRAIHHGNNNLADSEISILNNLKRLYSHYNDHPANVKYLIKAYREKNNVTAETASVAAEVQSYIHSVLLPKLQRLEKLNAELQVLQNTYNNQVEARSSAAEKAPLETKKLRAEVLSLSKRLTSLAVLCDFLPNLILCQASNWHSDKSLRTILGDCQNIAEAIEGYIPTLHYRKAKSLRVDDLLQIDFEPLASV
ncbi:hypothetical_protein [Candidozyma auris]|uniref:hypothetical_protein n=1 Tax=Candidozyma auris TaxID=498019 RepID=UPI000D2C8D6B|nr:hypothetical_protein [[Candida] auris]QEO24479.1 hypothetical_protein [[Candida] auris]GBL52276.1 hypothetical protein CAJCM15448_45500 [[Candida] auris]